MSRPPGRSPSPRTCGRGRSTSLSTPTRSRKGPRRSESCSPTKARGRSSTAGRAGRSPRPRSSMGRHHRLRHRLRHLRLPARRRPAAFLPGGTPRSSSGGKPSFPGRPISAFIATTARRRSRCRSRSTSTGRSTTGSRSARTATCSSRTTTSSTAIRVSRTRSWVACSLRCGMTFVPMPPAQASTQQPSAPPRIARS